LKEGKIFTCGGRVIAASATAHSLEAAVKSAYEGIHAIGFEGMFYRKDIAHRSSSLTPYTNMPHKAGN
jgi:phosphoribosylamine--glycine ligase/phosphoribosylformylglycinamidine cyclo-ligase